MVFSGSSNRLKNIRLGMKFGSDNVKSLRLKEVEVAALQGANLFF